MKSNFKAHPLFIFNLLKPFLFVLIFPLIKGLRQFLQYGETSGVFSFEILLFIIILFIAYLRYRSISIKVDNNILYIKIGIVFVRKAAINLTRVSSVKITKSPIDAIFGAVTYRINTEAGRKGKPDFEFKLSKKDSESLSELIYGEKTGTSVGFSVYKLAFLAATTSSAFTGIIISVPVIYRMGNLLGIALNEMLLNQINAASEKMNSIFPPLVNLVTLVVLAGYTVAFIYSFMKYVRFKILLGDEKFEVRSGFIVRNRTIFTKKSVNNVCIEQTALMRFFRRYSINVSIGGYGGTGREKAVLMPYGKLHEIKRWFSAYFPLLSEEGTVIKSKKSKLSKRRFLFLPTLYLTLLFAVSAYLMLAFPFFQSLILFAAAVLAVVILYYADLCLFNYRFGRLVFGVDSVYAKGTKGFNTRGFYCKKENVGEIKLIRYPNDMRFETCKVKITVRSEGADSIRIRNIDYKETIDKIKEAYGFNE